MPGMGRELARDHRPAEGGRIKVVGGDGEEGRRTERQDEEYRPHARELLWTLHVRSFPGSVGLMTSNPRCSGRPDGASQSGCRDPPALGSPVDAHGWADRMTRPRRRVLGCAVEG